jgi:hypothetical protein
MAKPMLATLPCALLLLDYWPIRRIDLPDAWRCADEAQWTNADPSPIQSLSIVIFEKIPFLLLSGIAIFFSLMASNTLGLDVSFHSVPMSARIANAFVSYWVYIRQLIWPTNLAFFYPFQLSISLWQSFFAALFLFVTFVFSARFAAKFPFFIVGWLWYLGTLVPAIGIVQAGLWPATADRFVYIPAIGLFMIVVWGIYALTIKSQWLTPYKIIPIIAIILIAVLLRADKQIRTWKNSVALFTNAIEVTKNNFVAHNNLGNILLLKGDLDGASQQYAEAIKASPRYPEAHNGLGIVLLRQKKIDSAIKQFKMASELNPANPHFIQNYIAAKSLAKTTEK